MSQLGMPAAAPADNDDRFPILPKPDGTDHGEGAGEDKTIDQQASTKPSTVIDPSTSSSTLPASTSASSQSSESPTVPKKKVRHSGTIVYIPPPEEIKDRDRENSDASCAEKVHTKPKTRKSSGWLPDSELGCVVCVVGTFVLTFLIFCLIYMSGVCLGFFTAFGEGVFDTTHPCWKRRE
ncbi:hypothetical protein QBC37DRAFT_369796 [Rhypophila decipiens]|uniref:Uncharacterized protein n=1 Tax=Rhypophila decipiens TaxID=261697 RepID=A0AAN6YK56_9PEZI|nr:hypothetical protein QBC37DRAFT_369796 [Rhypophila decipiens]